MKENVKDAVLAVACSVTVFSVLAGTICIKDAERRTYNNLEDMAKAVCDLNANMAVTEYRMHQVEAAVDDEKISLDVSELEMLARCVEAESGNQSIDVKRAVISVILNRVEDSDWPDSISEVIADPYEFATYWNNRMNEVEPSQSTYDAIQMEMDERSYPGLYYFDMDKFLPYGEPYAKMGDLYFSTK